MRKIFTLLFLSGALHGIGQVSPYSDIIGKNILFDSVCNTLKRQDGFDVCRLILRCGRVLSDRKDPLIILDGRPDTSLRMAFIDKNIIETIDSLKPASATAIYGPDGVNGAIYITTKTFNLRKFIIKDFVDGSRIAGATVLFESVTDRNEKFQFVANDSGVLITDKLNRSATYQMTVSAVGHTTLEQNFKNSYNISEKEFLLSRVIINCPEVVVTCFDCVRMIRCGGYRVTVTRTIEVADAKQMTATFRIFPNPVQRGGSLNLQFNNEDGIGKLARIISLDGKPLQQEILPVNKGLTNFRITTDARWAAGLYFIQVTYENGRVLASEKIIIQ